MRVLMLAGSSVRSGPWRYDSAEAVRTAGVVGAEARWVAWLRAPHLDGSALVGAEGVDQNVALAAKGR